MGLAASLARSVAERPDMPQVLCGDFNSPKGGGNVVYSSLTGGAVVSGAGLLDAAREAPLLSQQGMPAAQWPRSTIHKFQGLDFADTIGDGTVDLSLGKRSLEDEEVQDASHIDWILWRDGTGPAALRLQLLHFEVVTDRLA